jgi:hypothetical protein
VETNSTAIEDEAIELIETIARRPAKSPQPASAHLTWGSPTVLGLFAAALGLVGNFTMSWYNNRSQHELDAIKMRSELIQDAVKTSSVQQSCRNLLFFVETALLNDKNGKITQKCLYPLQQTEIPSSSGVSETTDLKTVVSKTDHGSVERYQVTFTVPNEPNAVFNTVKVYCVKMSQGQRVQEKILPPQQGNWKPGDRVSFTEDIPRDMTDAQSGWILTLCVGADNACFPSSNLLMASAA